MGDSTEASPCMWMWKKQPENMCTIATYDGKPTKSPDRETPQTQTQI